ncbi:DUF1592 domain-containing protein [Bdellovibrio reynosensis]|uniref:DUF1592 domain-containing protein n=1 Tax=Bdellovibrio reynosensis TaxID=2835041 RepID=A0ABY4C8R8_9BACT|nr:DUF1592 domain-containing protein [Bdellovibrio reynosensis]UOF01371.1 DUF1592 domain-containing protein [Bdellovibrio reynosensis]
MRLFRIYQLAIATGLVFTFQNCTNQFAISPDSTQAASPATGQDVTEPPDDTRFKSAIEIINARCVSCHKTGGSAAFAPLNFQSEQLFISQSLVVPGDPSKSKLIYRLKNYPDATATNRTMPVGSDLSQDEYNILYTWVSKMQPDDSGPFACDTRDTLLARSLPRSMKRLSKRQYTNTLVDLLSRGMSVSNATTAVEQTLNNVTLPKDDDTVFSRFDGSVVAQHMRAYFDVADSVAARVTNSTYYNSFVTSMIGLNAGGCSSINTASLSAACSDRFINNFGLRALRRPLNSEELILYRTTYETAGRNAAGINAVVFRFLMAPNFLFRIENEGSAVTADLLKMNSYEVASRLSYMFWNSMPDETLISLAASRDLSTDASFLSALNYVADSTKSQDSMKEFTEEWLHLSKIPQFATNNATLNYMADGITLDTSLRTAMIEEVKDLSAYVYRNNMSFLDLFTSNVSFARDSRLVSIYGVTNPAPANVTPTNAIRFPSGERAGVLTRAALLVGGSELANPIKRGIRIRKDILCLSLENPPADLTNALEPPPADINMTTRQRYDHATNPTACMNCHQYINSLGHALGAYNSFGKTWVQEPIFDENGAFTNRYLPVNTFVDLSTSIAPGLNANGPLELSTQVANQHSTLKCFSEKALRFTEERTENVSKEGCRLNNLYSKLKQSQSLKDFFKSMAQDPEFRHRLMQ